MELSLKKQARQTIPIFKRYQVSSRNRSMSAFMLSVGLEGARSNIGGSRYGGLRNRGGGGFGNETEGLRILPQNARGEENIDRVAQILLYCVGGLQNGNGSGV
jgi:hypothetical protein